MATQVTLGSGVIDSESGLKLRTNGTTEAVDVSTAQVVTLAKDAVVNGLTVGKGAGSVSTNTAVGASALAANTTGAYNTALGSSALVASTGDENTAIGSLALTSNTTGSYNTAVGDLSLRYNTTGLRNTAVGTSALSSNTSGGYNTGLGLQALYSNTTANYNTAVGYQAAYSNTTGTLNIAVGAGALYSNTTGASNAGLGVDALLSNSSGSFNTAIGRQSLTSNTTASNNTAVGYQAGYSNVTGTRNAMLGYVAGYSMTGNYCTLIGAGAGYSTTGERNTFVGDYAGNLITTGTKNTIIGKYDGNQGGLDIRTATGAVVISDGDGNPRFYSSGTGNDYILNQPIAGANTALVWASQGSAKWFIWRDNSSDRLNIVPSSFSSGVYLTNTATSWAAYSDRRIKSNIVDLEYGLNTVMAMQPRRYTVTANGENSIGFVAQELKAVLPEAVVGEEIEFSDDDTPQERSSKTMGVAKDNIIPVLVKAIQELKAEFDAYKEAHP